MIAIAVFLATCFLAYSNGANDNFKGVASLFGCKAASYGTAINWATITTFVVGSQKFRRFRGSAVFPAVGPQRVSSISGMSRSRSVPDHAVASISAAILAEMPGGKRNSSESRRHKY